jgi:hypothetical protein
MPNDNPEIDHLRDIMSKFSTPLLELEQQRVSEKIVDLEAKRQLIAGVLAERAVASESIDIS